MEFLCSCMHVLSLWQMFGLTYLLKVLGIDLWVLGNDEVYELYHILNRYSESSLEAAFWMMLIQSQLLKLLVS